MEYPEEKNTFAMEDEFLLGMSVSYFLKNASSGSSVRKIWCIVLPLFMRKSEVLEKTLTCSSR